jgi:hypothetical protein
VAVVSYIGFNISLLLLISLIADPIIPVELELAELAELAELVD